MFFDDFKVEHVKSPVVQMDDYYPFGLTFNSYLREDSYKNNHLYNSKELQDELNLGWMDYGCRMYIPELGRWGVPDPLSEKYTNFSSYNFVLNNPVRFIDPDGREVIFHGDDAKKAAKELNKSSSLRIKYNKKTGQLTAKGRAKTDYDKKLLQAINDKGVQVNVYTTKSNQISLSVRNGAITGDLVVGAYGGNYASTSQTYSLLIQIMI